jgi:hypothetical protein
MQQVLSYAFVTDIVPPVFRVSDNLRPAIGLVALRMNTRHIGIQRRIGQRAIAAWPHSRLTIPGE